MIKNEPPDSPDTDTSKDSASAQDFFQTFCKHLELNYAPGENTHGFDLPAHQIPTLNAVLATLVESRMVAEEVHEQIRKCLPKSDQFTQRTLGLGKGHLTVVSDDDEHLAHFEQYMP
jgi:hypothetical protein